ncbi:histidine utilization repressor [Yersinia ruckeri]|uniref:Histidine utilization repressor n=1 Tax=Yersinia ruckeri TaxID=29486 RepID=A0A085U896_YERRU|nr:histidine utilization repressor [Yersinia ruckeri]AKA37032.1 GntR family transcriptional regulator [Yersinia ruckeri]ARZ01256.1 GntR family transcriptional regulator [Yersinia ruckeri]AUQ43314.1 histidine utilization repressor [Yersinia ruckeri]EEP98884.1 Histidine utilization repressor [Yersinia ruckeri ATCC 29473]EKN3344990.1 histidine utilization repressor [Yersinia ruckeri]
MAEQQSLLQLTSAMSDAPAPIYLRVKQAIIRQIRSGTWQPHQRVPSESELVAELSVSRMTINRALRELTSEGFLIRMQGVGTFVAEAKAHSALLAVHNIADEIAARGHRHSSQILQLEARPASAEEASALGIQTGQQLFYSQIVHFENDIPVQVENRCVNPQTAPDYMQQDFSRITPYSYLTQAAPLTEGEHIVEAVMPAPAERDLLALKENEPCLLIRRRTWFGKAVVTSAQLLYPGSRYQLFGRFTPQGTVTS